jgi:two-component system cell cycle response regulator DivK
VGGGAAGGAGRAQATGGRRRVAEPLGCTIVSVPRPRVLLVDDHPDNRYMYALALTSAGFDVLEAHNGRDALESVAAVRPDIIVMDVGMPVMDGWMATQRLKADSATKHIPVIILTGHIMSGEGQHARAVGADSYLAKPCLPDDLIYEIRRLLPTKAKGRLARRQRPRSRRP